MTAPIVEGIKKAEVRTSVEINDSCNDCCPRFCCFGRKVKHHKRHSKEEPKSPNAAFIEHQIRQSIPKDGHVSPPLRVDVASGQVQVGRMTGSKIEWQPMPGVPEGSK